MTHLMLNACLLLLTFLTFLTFSLYALPTSHPIATSLSSPVIIKFKQGGHQSTFHTFLNAQKRTVLSTGAPANTVKYTYDPRIFNGIAGHFTKDFLDAFQSAHPGQIAYIEKDGLMHALGGQSTPPSWGMTRVSEHALDLTKSYTYPDQAGDGVEVYVIDTGIDPTNADFGGRATMAKSFVANEDAIDLNGHGTHVAGTIASLTYGLAKKVSIFGVKVLDAQGSGQYSDVVAGIQFVASNAKPGKTVINMSLGGPQAQSVDDAVNAAFKAGVVVIVAAGNSADDACQYSPAGAANAFAVGASDNTDTLASFSAIGKCVKVFGPGVDITSLWIGSQATNTISGTSMASPHVVGVAALYMSEKTYTNPQNVYDDLVAHGTRDDLKGLDATTSNVLVFNDVLALQA